MLEKMLDPLHGETGQVGVIADLIVAARQLRHRNRDDFFVDTRFVLHAENADRSHRHDGPGDNPALVCDENIDRIAIAGQRVRNEPVIAGIAHRRVEKPIDDQRAGFLVDSYLIGSPPTGTSTITLTSRGDHSR